MIEFLSSWLKSAPKWVKVVVPLVIAGLIAIYLLSSCSAIRQLEVERRQTREIKDTTSVHLVTSVYKRTVTRAARVRALPSTTTSTTAARPLVIPEAAAPAAAGTQAATARRCIHIQTDHTGAVVTTFLMPSP